MAEYAEGVESLVADMDAKFVELSDELQGVEPTMELFESVLERELAIIVDFTAGFRMLDPPVEAEELHATSLRVLERRIEAQEALAAEVALIADAGGDVIETITQLERTEAMTELRAADAEVLELCRVAQAQLNTTKDEADLAGLPWIPAELKDTIQVTLNCDPPAG